jgi:pimeloyl-ACP methyl ester carboxylesterase
MDASSQFSKSQDVATKVATLFQKRMKIAQAHYTARVEKVQKAYGEVMARPAAITDVWTQWSRYAVDFTQRSVLFWDTLRQRGNNFIEHNREGLPPVLSFEYEMVSDGRHFAQPVNYALVAITPPAGVTVYPTRRPYVIIDPRAGHGPGIGGFKDDSQVGVALAAGHPVYFLIFFRDPQPGQTLLDVCEAEKQFVRTVRQRHPDSPKPAIVGNCQGGWAAMMLAAADPDDTGPVVINGAPMSYWGGAWHEGEGDNPMRYAGGLLGGTWLSSLMADRGNGIFDGAHLVENFENLNPANTLWDKYYHVFANADTEPPRFLEFERWWGGFYLMNREEIEWITTNLFVGNKLWSGEVKENAGAAFDLRQIKSPIILFASMGDNITPPQQAFNWVADIYGSTEEIKARGQVIVGLLHQTIGHLGIFVSGKVAKKEHAQIVSVMKSVETLPPGLYGMAINERKGAAGKPEYDVEFHEHRLEDIVARLNRLQRADERPFEAVAAVSEFNQRAYELFLRPVVKATSNELTAKLRRQFHPLRVQRWAISDLNPWCAWLGPAAQAVKAQRQALPADDPLRKAEKLNAELFSAALDYKRALRDAVSEAAFFTTYANMFQLYLAEQHDAAEDQRAAALPADPRERPFVKEALARIAQGGYTEAFARVAYLLGRRGEPLPLSRVTMRQELAKEYANLVPDLPLDQWRRIRGEQEIIVKFELEKAIETLPQLLDEEERLRLLTLMERVVSDKRVLETKPTPEQLAMLERIRKVLGTERERPVDKRAQATITIQSMEGSRHEPQT